jgi:aminoglycoside phosphotransferase (APT) family kinase protein
VNAPWRHPNNRDPRTLPRELRRTSVPPGARTWIERYTGAEVVGVKRLPGASSTAVHGVVLSDGARLVLRRYVWSGFLQSEPDAPEREVDALGFATTRGLAVPEVIAADLTGQEVGDEVPAMLMARVAGRAVASPDPARLAEVAAAIHDVDPDGFPHHYFPWYMDTTTEAPPASSRPELWEKAIVLWHDEVPTYGPRFIHRDFHPGNVLWARGRVSGVVDWANACVGPPGCDLAHCVSNLTDLANGDVADEFLYAYAALTGTGLHPYWEMASILEHDSRHWTSHDLVLAEARLESAVSSMT